jgi:hypothetical protein
MLMRLQRINFHFRSVTEERAGAGMILKEDSCGSRWPLRLDWVTGQVPGENIWILHRCYWLWISCKIRWVWRDTAFERECKEQNEYVSKFCCSLTCCIIFRISALARNFCSLLNCLKDGSRGNKKHLSSFTSVLSISSVAKSAVVTPRRKYRFASFLWTFRGSSFSYCELFAFFSFSFLWVLKLLCVAQSSRWGRRNNSWSK